MYVYMHVCILIHARYIHARAAFINIHKTYILMLTILNKYVHVSKYIHDTVEMYAKYRLCASLIKHIDDIYT